MESINRSRDLLRRILDVSCGSRSQDEDGPAAQGQLVSAATLGALVLAAIWGVTVGSLDPSIAGPNLYKVPMVVTLSTIAALPAGLLARRLLNGKASLLSLLVSHSAAIFTATLALAVLAPLIGLYYHTSVWAGPILAQASAYLGIGLATSLFFRASWKNRPAGSPPSSVIVPGLVLGTIQVAALVQLIALASPILPEATAFQDGVDSLLTR